MNQFFIFRKLSMVPELFSDIGIGFKNIDKTCLEYAMENYGKNVAFNLPFEMIDTGQFIRRIYPQNIAIGLVGRITNLTQDIMAKLEPYDYIVIHAIELDEVIEKRYVLKKLARTSSTVKKILVLDVGKDVATDDLFLYMDISRIYGFRPVIRFLGGGNVENVIPLHKYRDSLRCTTKWFNYNVIIFIDNRSRGKDLLSVLVPVKEHEVEFIAFRDCMAFLCRGSNTVSIQSLLQFLYTHTTPVLRLGDLIIDEDFLNIATNLLEYHSIRATSKIVGVSYTKTRKIIKDIEKLEKILGVQLIEIKRGGSEHGMTMYTHAGRIVIENLKELYGEVLRKYSSIVSSILSELREGRETHICVFPLSI